MNVEKIYEKFFTSKGPYLEPVPRILLICIGILFLISTSTKAFSQAPLQVFLVGCAFVFAGLNGLRLSVFALSKDGLRIQYLHIPDIITPVNETMLQPDLTEGLEDRSWTPVNINQKTKYIIASIATTASGETTLPDQINKVYALKRDVNNLVVFTNNGRTLNLNFAPAAESAKNVGIQ